MKIFSFRAILIILCLTGAAILYKQKNQQSNISEQQDIAKENKQNIDVTAVKPLYKDLYDEIYVNGKAASKVSQDVYSKVNGIVTSIRKHDSEFTKKGETIIAISQDLAQANLDSAVASFKEAEEFYNNQQKLIKKEYTSEETLQKAKSIYLKAKLNLETAKQNYNDMVIKAPFDGEVGAISLVEGNDVKVGDFLFSIISGDIRTILLNVPEEYVDLVDEKTPGSVRVGEENINAKVVATSQYINKSGHGIIKLEAKDSKIMHGSFVQARLLINPHKGIVIPAKAIMRSQDGSYVYVVKNNIAEKVPVKISEQKMDIVEVTQGEINKDSIVIIEGLTKIKQNTPVNATIKEF